MAPHSNTLAWKIPWTEEPGRLQSMGSLRVGHDWATSLWLFTFMHWRRKRQPTPLFLSGESQGRRSLVGCHLWGRRESDWSELAAAAAARRALKVARHNFNVDIPDKGTHVNRGIEVEMHKICWKSSFQYSKLDLTVALTANGVHRDKLLWPWPSWVPSGYPEVEGLYSFAQV